MKYPVLLVVTAALFVSLVFSETLRNDANLSHLWQDEVNGSIRERRAANPQAPGHQPAVEHINYRPYSQVPSNIKQLLQFQQAREPITHIAAQPPPQLAKAPTPARPQYNPQVQYGAQSPQAQSPPQYQAQPQAAYQPQQHPQQPQAAYNPGGHPQALFNPQQLRLPNSALRNPQQHAAGNVFHPEQRRLY